MKKILCLLISMVMLFGVTACGGGGTSSPTEIYVAVFKGAYGETFIEKVAEEFEKTYAAEGYKVRFAAAQNIEDTIQPQIRANNGPDVIYLPTGQTKALTEGLIKSKSLLELTSLLDEKIVGEDVTLREKILPSFLGNMITDPYNDGKTYTLPLFYAPLGLFYNKSLFNADGSDGKYKLPTTREEFLALRSVLDAENATKPSDEKRYLLAYPNAGYMAEYLFANIASATDLTTFNNFLNYEDVYSNTNFRAVFSDIEALKGYVYQTSWDTATNYKDNQNTLLQNKALFLPSGTWLPSEMTDYTPAEGFEYGFSAQFNFSEQSTRYAAAKLEQVYILKQSKKQDIAKKFISFLFSDKATQIIAQEAKALVPTVNALDQAQTNGYLDEQLTQFYDIYADGSVKVVAGGFASANIAGVNWADTFQNNVNNIMKGTKTASEWLTEMRTVSAQLKAAIVK